MATLEQIEAALRKADAAGNVEDAKRLAAAYRSMRGQSTSPQPAAPADDGVIRLQGKVTPMQQPAPSFGDQALSFGRGVIEGIPIAGPALSGARREVDARLGEMMGRGSADELRTRFQEQDKRLADQTPLARVGGNVAGAVGSMIPLGMTGIGAKALGMTGGIWQRVGMGLLSSAGIGGADAIARGSSPSDAMKAAGIAGGIGAAIPAVGAGFGAGIRAIGNKAQPIVGAIRNVDDEAARRLGVAYNADAALTPGALPGAADEAMAQRAGIDFMNADRGGETVRALSRSVTNQSPPARQIIGDAADQRFGTQGSRAVEFVKQLTGGAVDDLGYQKAIKDTAAMVNKPRYDKAYSSPAAAAVWTPEIRQLMQSDQFRKAIVGATTRGTDVAAVSGVKAVRNPFKFGPNGEISLVVNADGSRALPSLQFWDVVKRNLDSQIGVAQRAGDNSKTALLTQMKTMLVRNLDEAVPEYQAARQGAAGFFGAEDALEAGRTFARQPRNVPEAKQAFAKFNAAEKKAFQTGYASEIIDKIKATGDRVNVINSTFKSQASRDMLELAFGPQKLRELEAYVRVEDIADKLRGAMGNSTTARQLVEMGLAGGQIGGGGLAGFMVTGNPLGAAAGAAATAGAKYLDQKVMVKMAEMLTSKDPAIVRRAMQNAAISPAHMQALEIFGNVLAPTARGANFAAQQQATSGF